MADDKTVENKKKLEIRHQPAVRECSASLEAVAGARRNVAPLQSDVHLRASN